LVDKMEEDDDLVVNHHRRRTFDFAKADMVFAEGQRPRATSPGQEQIVNLDIGERLPWH